MPTKSIERLWKKISPEYLGKVGQAVLDLGITHRAHTRSSPNQGRRLGDSAKVAGRTQALALAVRDKVALINTASHSKSIYGAAVDLLTQGQMNTLRGRAATAVWPKKYVARKVTGLLLSDKGDLEPGIASQEDP
eukprot:16419359-Heterocapsa_arctica.AAC.1